MAAEYFREPTALPKSPATPQTEQLERASGIRRRPQPAPCPVDRRLEPGRIPEGQCEPLTRAHLGNLRKFAPKAKLIFATTTPMTTKTRPIAFDPEFNPLIVERNKIAVKVMEENQVPVANYYSLLATKLDLAAGDRFHWTKPAYELLAELKQFIQAQQRRGKSFSRFHVQALLALRDPNERQVVLKKCVASGWSSKRLRLEVQNRRGFKGHLAGHSPEPIGPVSPGVALREIYKKGRQWMALHQACFGGQAGSLKRVTRKDRSLRLYEELGRARRALLSVRDASDEALAQLAPLAGELEASVGKGATPV